MLDGMVKPETFFDELPAVTDGIWTPPAVTRIK